MNPLRTLAGGLAIALTTVILFTAPSLAAASHPHSLTFAGQCQLTGNVGFSPKMTTTPSVVRNYPSAAGTCSGSLTKANGQTTALSNAPVRYRAFELGTQESCASNLDASGTGELIFAAGPLRFQIIENRVSGTAALSFTGDAGGSAGAVANVNSSSPQGILEQCAMGGVASVPVQLVIATTPSISG
jgi:hypothetical protein